MKSRRGVAGALALAQNSTTDDTENTEGGRARRTRREQVLSLEVLAREATTEAREEPTQFRVLVRHFLERFFTSEMAQAEGEAKTRLVQAACALSIPGLIVAMYLYPVYHLPHGHVGRFWGPRPYWSQAGEIGRAHV